MKCPNCGIELLAGAKFCQNCGTRITWPGAEPQGNPAYNAGAGPANMPNPANVPDPADDPAAEAARDAVRKAEQAEAARRALAAEKQRDSITIPDLQIQNAVQDAMQQPRPETPMTAAPTTEDFMTTASMTTVPMTAVPTEPAGPAADPEPAGRRPRRSLKLVILLSVIGLILAGAAAYFLLGPKTVRLSDYFTVVVEGADGYGSASLVWDEEKLAELNSMIGKRNRTAFEAAGGSMDRIVSPSLRSDTPDGQLRNGDIVNIRYPDLSAFEKDCRIRFKYTGTYEVKDLRPVTRIDLLDHVVFTYEGYSGWGTGTAALDGEGLTAGDLTVILRQNAEAGILRFDLTDTAAGGLSSVIYRTDSRADRLSNGETVTYSFAGTEGYDGKWLGAHGVELVTDARGFEAEGLAALQQVDFFTALSAEYTGFSTRGQVEVKLDADTIAADEALFSLSLRLPEDAEEPGGMIPELWAETEDEEFLIRIVPEGAEQGKIENGQQITYRIPDDEEIVEFLASHGIEAVPAEKTFVIEGLPELQSINVLDALNVKATGYNGYGKLTVTLTEESAKAGDYTLQYKLPQDAFGMDVEIVKSGKTAYTVSYRAKAQSLKNDDVITLKADAELLKKIDAECGIVLPASRDYTVSGLKDTTEIEPRDYIKPVFTKKGDKITGTLTVTKDSFKAGSYTIRLAVDDVNKGDHRKVVFSIVDDAGKELAKGSYTLNNVGGVGTNATIDYNGELDPKTAAEKYGLVFKTEAKEVKITVS